MTEQMTSALVSPSRPWDMANIRKSVAAADLVGGLCGRISGFWIGRDECSSFGTAWMCNMADAERFDVAFPVTLMVRWDKEGKIGSIDLDEKFEGSQGITCSRSFVERQTQKSMLGKSLRTRQPVIANPLNFGCRHVFELVYGLAAFKEHLDRCGLTTGEFRESTVIFKAESGLLMRDVTVSLGASTELELSLDMDSCDIGFDRDGVLQRLGNVRLHVTSLTLDGIDHGGPGDNSFEGNSNSAITSNAVRTFTPLWKMISVLHGQGQGLLFSNLWPPSAYSVFVQGLAQMLFHNNFTYFQHCIGGLQRTGGQPKCVGVIQSLEEAASIFPELRREDFF